MASLMRTSVHLALLLICFICLQRTANSNLVFLRNLRIEQQGKFLAHVLGQKNWDDLVAASKGQLIITDFDREMRHLFVALRRFSMQHAKKNMAKIVRKNRSEGKMQPFIPEEEPFPCDLSYARSTFPPTSVHELRPGDIDIIATFGDSISAGNGIMSNRVLHILNEFRAFSFTGGGYGDWRSYLTLPNILKAFNPNLYGYSTANELTVDSTSHLNIAEPMIMSRDLPHQAKVLIKRMREDPNINMKEHWKLLSIYVGSNDICSDMCHRPNKTEFIHRHEMDLRRALTILRDNVPRMLVNILPVASLVVALNQMHKLPFGCYAVHRVGCHCLVSHTVGPREAVEYHDVILRWQEVDQYVSQLPEFQTNDFAVVYQPFAGRMHAPTLPNGDVDFRYFASDCFHFSQLGQAALANSLWNSMLQPIGQKTMEMPPPFTKFECPSEERPFLATLANSFSKK